MKKYLVTVTSSQSAIMKVEASSPQEAEDYAVDHSDEFEVDGDDWEEYEVEEML